MEKQKITNQMIQRYDNKHNYKYIMKNYFFPWRFISFNYFIIKSTDIEN